ncbi:hypothetical protein WB904_004024 [Vibrio parahaemolyticus]|nr:hypothetical protein [Vibrio parahaemolyticus]EIA1343045.1 hypothetical protein [Vibrio parahaemolyticus]
MTAEVVIYNKSAIALAADSAVSIEGSNSHKVYNNAEKLFALTKHHPVALMIYESNELQGVPWELIIKSYRKHLGIKSFNTLQEYKDDFLNFVQNFYVELPSKFKANQLAIYLNHLVLATINKVFEYAEDLTAKESRPIDQIDSAVNELIERYEELPTFDGLESFITEHISEDFTNVAIEALAAELDTSGFTEQEDKDWLNTCNSFYALCKLRAIKQDPFYTITTGLVFAGYGDKEFFPEMLECEVYGILDNKLKIIRKQSMTKDHQGSAGLKAFAQHEEVDTFMHGICAPTRKNHYDNFETLHHFALSLGKNIINKYVPKESQEEALDLLSSQLVSNTAERYEDMHNHTQTQFINKVTDMVGHLPKNELAYMAESLVNLTAFKRKVSNDADSVGGPIDVAIISKGDGFVWIKRKHYFPGEINKHYGKN